MGLFVAFIIWYNIWGKSNPKVYRSMSGNISKIITGIFFASIVMSSAPPLFIGSFVLLVFLAAFIGIPWLVISSIMKALGLKTKKAQKDDYEYYQKYYKSPKQQSVVTMTGLTKSVPKRRKIVDKFNKKYNLTLTDEEISRIVDASYMSNCWECEIYEMSLDYDSVYQWYKSDTGWLRAYLHAFPVQSVSSDFEMQHRICIDSFDEIFQTIHPENYPTVDACIKAINGKFMLMFDETTFMIAYRFLEANNRKYKLPHVGLAKQESDLERLQKKYDDEAKTEQGGHAEGKENLLRQRF